MARRSVDRAGVLPRVLVAERSRNPSRDFDHPIFAGSNRSFSAADWHGAAAMGAQQSGWARTDACSAFEIPDFRRVLQILRAFAYGGGRLLGHSRAEHSGFH